MCGLNRRGAQALQRREPLLQTRGHKLIDPLWRLNVLQPVKAQVTDRYIGRQPRSHQQPRRLRQHHLAAVRRRRDPRRPVNIQPDVPILMPRRLPRVQAHPDPHHYLPRPVMGGKSALRRHAAADGIAGRLKHHKKAVPLGAHLPAAARRKRGP